MSRATPAKSVVGRALQVLSGFDEEHRVLSLAELAARAGLPQSTAYRHAVDLVAWGALDRVSGGYRVGGRMLRFAAQAAPDAARPAPAVLVRPHLEALRDESGGAVVLARRSGRDAVCVDVLPVPGSTVPLRPGTRLPLPLSAIGQAILAFLPPNEITSIVAPMDAAVALSCPRGRQDVEQCLTDTRGTGVAASTSEFGGTVVATPVFDADARPVASVAMVLLSPEVHPSSWFPALRVTARVIGRVLARPGPARRTAPQAAAG